MLKTPGGDREMVEILALVLQHDEQAVLTVVEPALEAGVPTKTHILNLLHRLVEGKPIDSPAVNDRVWWQCCDCLQTDFALIFCTTPSCQLARGIDTNVSMTIKLTPRLHKFLCASERNDFLRKSMRLKFGGGFSGAPDRIRTCDLCLRRAVPSAWEWLPQLAATCGEAHNS